MWGFFFLAFGLMRVFFAIGDFTDFSTTPGVDRVDIISIGYLIMSLGSWQFIYFMERRIAPHARIHPLSTIYVVLIAFLVAIFWIDKSIFQILAVLLGAPFLIMWLVYIVRIRRKAAEVGRTLFFTYSVGLFGLIGGFLATNDTLLQITETFTVRAIGDGVLVLSMIMLGYFVTKLPAWGEFTWKGKTQAIYLFYIGNGLAIFEYHFHLPTAAIPDGGKGSVLDQDLLIPGLTSLKELLEKISSVAEPPKTYKQEDATIVLEYGQWVGGAAICTEDLRAVRRLLRRFIRRVESIHGEILPEWDGNLSNLSRVKNVFNHLIATARAPSDQSVPVENIPLQRKTGKGKKIKPHPSKKLPRLKPDRKKKEEEPKKAESLPDGMRVL